ncbi:MAG: type I-E CRISPR-associated endoribonuclease Cas2 [Bryobacterales bacterium]|nr:type I-E CRISPR-associated endoribonuclease Cas2 [Bryobacterales bacterium]
MVVIILERVPASLRGELSRWMIEVKAGVFVGRLSAMVRERLWGRICSGMKGGAGILIHQADCEQGYQMRFWGATSRYLVDHEGLTLLKTREVL